MSDEKIIEEIRAGRVDQPIKLLYKELPKIASLIKKAGGGSTDVKEVFHDGLILLIEKVEDPAFSLQSKLSTFLFGICRLLWMNRLLAWEAHLGGFVVGWVVALLLDPRGRSMTDEEEPRS